MAASSSSQVVPAQSPQVFINFRGELRNNFVSHLVVALEQAEINYYIDSDELRSEDKRILFTRIQESQIALCIFSSMYADSDWCLDELVKIMEEVKKEKLKMIPIFFKVKPDDVGRLKNDIGVKLYSEGRHNRPNMPLWEEALMSVPDKMGLTLENCGNNERELIKKIVAAVKQVLAQPVSRQTVFSQDTSPVSSGGNSSSEKLSFEDVMNKLKEMIDFECPETQIIGIVGMPGIGKTALAEKYFNKYKDKFVFKENIRGIRGMSQGEDWLQNTLLRGQPLDDRAAMFTKKILLVLDDVSHRNQLEFLLEHVGWIRKGSKIVITTRDKSSIAELVHHIYVVPGLNDTEASELFKHHAFYDEVFGSVGNFPKLTKKFVDYAGGNPGALVELGKELCGKEEAHWEKRLVTLPHCSNPIIRNELTISYNTLTENQKDVFLDIACFFRSEEEDYVKCLLDQQICVSGDGAVKDLAEKLLICISAGRIEMHNLLCTFGKDLGSFEENMSGERMCNRGKIIATLLLEEVTNTYQRKKKVRGIFLDTYKEEHGIPVDSERFVKKFNPLYLRYLKIYDSLCPQNCKVNLPDGLEFPFQEIRYLHWQNFQLAELPPDFDPKNLIDLRLPYSKKIQRVWEAVKEVPRLKWVDLSYSTKLTDLSALSKAYNLRRLNLEGCTILDKLPGDMNNMRSLVFLNLRGCVELSCLPSNLSLISLKTLILSGCSKFNNFELISKNLEFLHLDGTAIARLPPTIQDFPKLVLLNLRNCKKLGSLPASLYMLKALEEVILSGCSEIKSFPEIKENMENMQILLLDGTSIEEVPKMLLACGNNSIDQGVVQRPPRRNGLFMLRRLCLSRNDRISSLESCLSQLYHLKWIDLRYCTSLTSLLTLPPNLEYLNAHACISLKTVASPLALLMPTEQASSSFIFTNCEKLEQVAKNEIICYAHKKSQLLSDALNRQNKGIACETLVATCFPGSVVPAWFNHRASGAMLEPELPPYLSDNWFVGIALCAIVSFQDYEIQNNNFKVKCVCELNNVEMSSSFFNFHIGDLSEPYDDKQQSTVKSTHVFIGFTSWLNINQCQKVEAEKGCVPTKASIRFEVTDGTCEAAKCEVVKCGFSLVCESDNDSWDASSTVTESGNRSAGDINVDVSPGGEEGNQGAMRSIWRFLRQKKVMNFYRAVPRPTIDRSDLE